ncbi:unnamed protein product [Chironomus riparius]|uniref:glutathione transferase n=1 Tax=Chironomus riparius TaxID=315576 RepID=A0A9N9RI16_9DIPT|nr:unnamed protein product [Chironomus riparius]
MKLYYADILPQSRTALMTIRNLNIEVELIHVNFSRGENKNEEFLKLNPAGQVPVLVEDDGFILTESRAIIAYLVASRDENSSLYPLNDPIKRALIDERLHFDATTVFHSHVQILHPMIANSDPKIPEEKKKILRNVLSVLNGFLDNKNWFTGESPTIADFSILSNLIVILCAGIRIESYKNLSVWFSRCKGLTGFEENYKGGRMVMELLKKKNLPPISL